VGKIGGANINTPKDNKFAKALQSNFENDLASHLSNIFFSRVS
jgi:hypothetical protein